MRKIAHFIAEFLHATIVTAMFGFVSWLGASSALWCLGFVALGAGIDFWRGFYRYDWALHRFVRYKWNERDFFFGLEQLSANTELFEKGRRTGRLFFGCVISAWLCSVFFLLFLSLSYGDAEACEASTVHKLFSYIAAHLVYTVRSIPPQLVEHGYACRSVFVELYYAATFYTFVVSTSVYAILWSHDSTLLWIAHLVRTEGMAGLKRRANRGWSVLIFFVVQYASCALFFRLLHVQFNSHGGRTWNIHDSNFPLVMFSICVVSSLAYLWLMFMGCRLISVSFWLEKRLLSNHSAK